LKLLLKAASVGDAKAKELRLERKPVQLRHLAELAKELAKGEAKERLALTIALVAFWGMARLGELVSDNKSKVKILWNDLLYSKDKTYLRITIRNAKTAKPGEVQFLTLKRIPSLLCPLSAIDRLDRDNPKASLGDPIFLYCDGKDRRMCLSKTALINMYKRVWKKTDKSHQLSGHSFRIGGATLNWNNEIPLDEIVRLGRWESKAYQVYLRKYSKEDVEDAKYIWTLMKKDEVGKAA
jgi:hypothetical protein